VAATGVASGAVTGVATAAEIVAAGVVVPRAVVIVTVVAPGN
jgi:hypothetical protein